MKNIHRTGYLIDLFVSISQGEWAEEDGVDGSASCENAVLAREAARLGMSTERLTTKYLVYVGDVNYYPY